MQSHTVESIQSGVVLVLDADLVILLKMAAGSLPDDRAAMAFKCLSLSTNYYGLCYDSGSGSSGWYLRLVWTLIIFM